MRIRLVRAATQRSDDHNAEHNVYILQSAAAQSQFTVS
jgi:hypothetical protein